VLSEGDRTVAVQADAIEPGARVIVSALPVVTEGMRVRVAETSAAPPVQR
jgi:hypothetical protein